METEIRSQPALLARLAEDAAPLVAELGRVIARRRRGSPSWRRGAPRTTRRSTGSTSSKRRPASSRLSPRRRSTRSTGEARMSGTRSPSGISQSGQSPDIVAAIDAARRAGALALAVTNDETSPLARVADLVLPLRVGPERSIAATKTFTAELLALWLLVGAIARRRPGRRAATGPSRWPNRLTEAERVAATVLARRRADPDRRGRARVRLPDRTGDRTEVARGRSPERARVLRGRPAPRIDRRRSRRHGGHPGRGGWPDRPEPARLR